jgi:Holliday junction resolvase
LSLDVNTPMGQFYVAKESVAITILEKHNPGVKYIHTPSESSSVVDLLAIRNGNLSAIGEVKSRNMTEAQLQTFDGEWLVTFEKLQEGARVAKALRVPFYGVLHLIPEDKVLVKRLADEDGQLLAKMRIERTQTQATCNGGQKIRTNAYIDMKGAKVYE